MAGMALVVAGDGGGLAVAGTKWSQQLLNGWRSCPGRSRTAPAERVPIATGRSGRSRR
jgi:hypothetical protein